MDTAVKEQQYPYIDSDPGIARGSPVITGTRITVRAIAGYYQMGMSVDEILATLPHLRLSQVHSALAYYFDHQEQIDLDIAETSDLEAWKSRTLQHPKQIASSQ
ncbi:MAG: DUF433 domain-containing protein [Deltaproteobacteria bacterium]|nr:DUF433 domain-containing protein [Deltaproteobacteria bacterium]